MPRSILQGTQIYDSKEMQNMQWANSLINLTGALALTATTMPVILAFGAAAPQTVTLPPLTGVGAMSMTDSRVHALINTSASAITLNAHANDGGATVATLAAGSVTFLFSLMKLAVPKWFSK